MACARRFAYLPARGTVLRVKTVCRMIRSGLVWAWGGMIVFWVVGHRFELQYSDGRGDCARTLGGDAVRHGDRVTYVLIE